MMYWDINYPQAGVPKPPEESPIGVIRGAFYMDMFELLVWATSDLNIRKCEICPWLNYKQLIVAKTESFERIVV